MCGHCLRKLFLIAETLFMVYQWLTLFFSFCKNTITWKIKQIPNSCGYFKPLKMVSAVVSSFNHVRGRRVLLNYYQRKIKSLFYILAIFVLEKVFKKHFVTDIKADIFHARFKRNLPILTQLPTCSLWWKDFF